MKVCEFYRNVCEEAYDKSEDEFYEDLINKFEVAISEYEKEKEVLIQVSSDYEIYSINNKPYFENQEYVLVNNVLPDHIDNDEEYDEEVADDYGYDDDDDYF